MSKKKIKTALISVFDKTGLEPLINILVDQGVELYSTGGTEKFIRNLGYDVNTVEDLTGYPAILGGRVKTLHPKVFGGILGRRDLEGDKEQMGQYAIPEIDLVIVDLYPFEDTVNDSKSHDEIIEKIEVHRPSVGKPQLYPNDDLVIALASDEPILECPFPFFDLEDVAGIAAFILVQTKLKQAS